MVDYYTQYYALPPPYRLQHESADLHNPHQDERPLNLCLRSEQPSTSQAGHLFSSEPCPVDVVQQDNLVIVSDLDCAIAQEEVVEAVEDAQLAESESDGEEEVELVKAEEALTQEYSKNIQLKTEHDKLSRQIAKIREILDREVRRERTENQPECVDHEVEVKSEGEMDTGSEMTPAIRFPATKRSRNHSWPQMSAINQRKKEQNKMASKRFRERKKLELARAQQSITELESKNNMLRTRVDSMQSKADILKKILQKLQLIKIYDLPTGQSTIVKV
eukprot:TRINITY_DN51410_c0_g1_i1.p1 TRINITY_DN51410_c0_g1~~TRINITY_DN51410_c0_g1_i1.p1  ORF type:complete len:276 (+),score=43.65 TRINITY_DN51410_c0_g1_i1:8-835(+)